jgi:uncharacterized protein YggE
MSGPSGVVITVRGAFESSHPPERGTVTLQVGFEGPTQEIVFGRTATSANAVAARIAAMLDPSVGPVTRWSSDQLRTWSNRPWTNDGKQLPPVHHARVGFEVEFSDLARLSSWVSEVALLDGVSVQGVQWALSADRHASLIEQARAAAVLNARDKANAYAASLGLQDVRPVAIADVGLLGDNPSFTGDAVNASARVYAASSPEVELAPKDVQLSAAVDARFLAT